ncbi:hypothetical protein [Vibrio hyugaensis]|uniref:DNA-directed RNA polymerase subunit beta n=1 Tax=Vibrio hyugaensis TaxID=1534743 RepID=A0ABQ5Y8F2_9VIBR|nr:hypothetical protein [Vibrio hyugaensis]GLR07165.1 hypothetical protein GCM10007906_47530 [Vibrio hyugaensis]
MNNTYKLFLIAGISLPSITFAQPVEQIAEYLQEQSNQHQIEDHYAQKVHDGLNLDAQPNAIKWKDDEATTGCRYAKAEVTEANDYDYGEANNLSDGLHHIDLQPIHTPKKLQKNPTYNTASSDNSMKFSVSSDCL